MLKMSISAISMSKVLWKLMQKSGPDFANLGFRNMLFANRSLEVFSAKVFPASCCGNLDEVSGARVSNIFQVDPRQLGQFSWSCDADFAFTESVKNIARKDTGLFRYFCS